MRRRKNAVCADRGSVAVLEGPCKGGIKVFNNKGLFATYFKFMDLHEHFLACLLEPCTM